MKVISPRMRWAASLGAFLLIAGFPEWIPASPTRVNNVSDSGVNSSSAVERETHVFRLSGPNQAKTKGG
jgi:hypothetical protein